MNGPRVFTVFAALLLSPGVKPMSSVSGHYSLSNMCSVTFVSSSSGILHYTWMYSTCWRKKYWYMDTPNALELGRRRDNFLLTAAYVPLGLGARFEPQAELAHEW